VKLKIGNLMIVVRVVVMKLNPPICTEKEKGCGLLKLVILWFCKIGQIDEGFL
jgi:hypothetical protein